MAINWKEIDRIAKAQKQVDPGSSEEALLRQLREWWCIKYSRPFKDPLLQQYALDELAYEYLCHFYSDPDNDPAKEAAAKAQKEIDDEWIKGQLTKMALEKSKSIPEKVETPQPPELPDFPEISTVFDQ